jgi:hypothetical protein
VLGGDIEALGIAGVTSRERIGFETILDGQHTSAKGEGSADIAIKISVSGE